MRELETTFYESIFRAILATLATLVLVACYSADVPGALRIAAHVALIYGVMTMALAEPRRATAATQQLAFARTQRRAPRAPDRRPDTCLLHFAQAGVLVAIALEAASVLV